MATYPFSEIMVGDKFILKDDDKLIKVKTGPSNCKFTGDVYVGDGEVPETNGETGEMKIDPQTSVVKLLDLVEMVEQIQHQIWEHSISEDASMDDILENLIEQTADCEDEEDSLIHKVAVMIRNARDE